MQKTYTTSDYYKIIEQSISYIEKNIEHSPPLKEIAQAVGLSEQSFQEIFTQWSGVCPEKFIKLVKLNQANINKFNDNSYSKNVGFDLSITVETTESRVTKSTHKDTEVIYGINKTPFGEILAAETNKGLSDLLFITGSQEESLNKVIKRWPSADFSRNDEHIQKTINQIFYNGNNFSTFKIHLKGTNFQIKVWQALLNIPKGKITSYSDISKSINKPDASRAVGTAIGKNPIHYLIPCHRVLRSDGNIGGYAGGTERKRAILALEACTS